MTNAVTPSIDLENAVVLSGGFPLLSGLDLQLPPGSLTVITGANGAGKTSLLRLLAGLVQLSEGSGTVAGIDLKNGDLRQLRRRVGWLGHEGSFYDDPTVRENLTFAAKALDRPLIEIERALSRVGLSNRIDTVTKKLSAGQRRRLGLSWLLIRRPEIWLLDEPYASLDDEARTFFDALIADVLRGGSTVVISAHDKLKSEALQPRTLVLGGGRIVSES